MTTDSVPTGSDPRRLLADARSLARRVRADQRLTWVTLLVLAGVTFLAIPFDWFFLVAHCTPAAGGGEACRFDRQGMVWFWPPALLLAYGVIAYLYVRVARSRGLGARVLPYVITGAALVLLFIAAAIAVRVYLHGHPVGPDAPPTADWILFLDRLVAPWGTIGIALLVLAWLERNPALLAFTALYLVVVLTPVDFGWGHAYSIHTAFLPQQVINGTVLLLGAIGFAWARRRTR
ncbi:hypothetical protein ACQP2F_19450 [Actinoplanes sp. CA-030573]|uniref:hypothetical protein n=1 Tax=Actinoplanes sp. CA-030573 TaxID=3239898 RepID=UPI003D8BEDC2